jgi:hypothetical protein
MVNKRSIPANYSYHRPILSDVHPFEVPPTFSNGGFFDFVTKYDVRLEQRGRDTFVVWECPDDRLDEVIQYYSKPAKSTRWLHRQRKETGEPSRTQRKVIFSETEKQYQRENGSFRSTL